MIIGITGTAGAGKGTVVEHLKGKGFKHYSARGFIIEEIKRRGMEIDRDATRIVGNDLRKSYHPAYIVEQLHAQALKDGGFAIIESIRSVGEAEFLKEKGAHLVAIDADRRVRYERNVLRGTELDKITFEKFCEQEDKEMAQTEKFEMNIKGVMALADAVLTNDGEMGDLHIQIEKVLDNIKQSKGN